MYAAKVKEKRAMSVCDEARNEWMGRFSKALLCSPRQTTTGSMGCTSSVGGLSTIILDSINGERERERKAGRNNIITVKSTHKRLCRWRWRESGRRELERPETKGTEVEADAEREIWQGARTGFVLARRVTVGEAAARTATSRGADLGSRWWRNAYAQSATYFWPTFAPLRTNKFYIF